MNLLLDKFHKSSLLIDSLGQHYALTIIGLFEVDFVK